VNGYNGIIGYAAAADDRLAFLFDSAFLLSAPTNQ
jgi:hypothetical protein